MALEDRRKVQEGYALHEVHRVHRVRRKICGSSWKTAAWNELFRKRSDRKLRKNQIRCRGARGRYVPAQEKRGREPTRYFHQEEQDPQGTGIPGPGCARRRRRDATTPDAQTAYGPFFLQCCSEECFIFFKSRTIFLEQRIYWVSRRIFEKT